MAVDRPARWSNLVRFYWWLLVLLPVLSILLSLDEARSADEAVGHAMFFGPWLLLAGAMAAFVLYRAARAADLTRADRALVAALGLGVVPLFVLVSTIGSVFQNWPRGASAAGRPLMVGLTAAWILLAIAARRTLHRGVPAGWPQLRRAAWLALAALLPPVSTMLALGQTVPDYQTRQLPQGLWPFVIGALLLAPLLFHRAISARTPAVDRVLILLSSLVVLVIAVLTGLAWHIGGGWPEGTPLRWGIAGVLIAAWIVLAAVARRRLGR